jgi:hypothetical protein
MALPTALNDREYQKFIDISPGETAVRVSGQNFSGSFSVSGLKNGGRVTEVTINSSSWTALPPTALSNRNAMSIQNYSGVDVKLNYDNATVGYVGAILQDGNERFYDISDAIVIYAKASSGTPTLIVEELS